jgi:hypothetical protein
LGALFFRYPSRSSLSLGIETLTTFLAEFFAGRNGSRKSALFDEKLGLPEFSKPTKKPAFIFVIARQKQTPGF